MKIGEGTVCRSYIVKAMWYLRTDIAWFLCFVFVYGSFPHMKEVSFARFYATTNEGF